MFSFVSVEMGYICSEGTPQHKEGSDMPTTTIRVNEDIQTEVARIAAMRGISSGDLLGQAWREFLDTHKDQLAEDLEQVAGILRDGTTQDLANFLSRDVDRRAQEAAAKARS